MTEIDAHLVASLARRFRLVRQLGAGGMGAVYLAEQIAVGNRPVALKVLSREGFAFSCHSSLATRHLSLPLDDPDFLLRFQNEAASTGRIHHPNVVTIYESGQADDGTPYVAMEFLEGESLRQALARRGALPVPEVAEILQQAARGLNAAHKLGIIHRDLKPDNIFLTYPDDAAAPLVGAHDALAFARDVGAGFVPALPVGTADTGRAREPALNAVKGPPLRPVVVKLVDFGIAKLRESGAHTQTGMVLGTPAYMSYEQASGMRSDELDGRSDVYSLGVVVYEMFTGRTPFHSDTPIGYLRMHIQEAPPPFRAVKPGLPALPQLESVVMKALTKDRNRRYNSVLEFGREFAQAAEAGTQPDAQLEPQRQAAKSQHQITVTTAPKARHHLLKKVGLALAALCALGVLGGGGYYAWTRYLAWRDMGKLTRTCREWESKHPVGSPLDFITVEKQKDGSFRVVESGGTQLVTYPPSGCSGPLEDAYIERDVGRVNSKDGLKYVWIPPGTFMMGCSPGDNQCGDDEKPRHQVTITKGFWLGQTEVTVGAYKRYAGATGNALPPAPNFNLGWSNKQMPMVGVSWYDALAYCVCAGGRLPSESEWEYAARAGSTAARYGDLNESAWYADNSGGQHLDSERILKEDEHNYSRRLKENGNGMHAVGQKRANDFGLFDMLGNVWEWVEDWYDRKYYRISPSQDPLGPTTGQYRLLRGAAWLFYPSAVRVSVRYWSEPGGKDFAIGFRCVGEVAGP